MTGLATRGMVAGRYRMERRIGRGGMSEVWVATDKRLGRKVALKFLDPDLSSAADFEREAGILSGLRHANIVTVYDAGTEDERRFIAMELVAGESLRESLQRGGALSVEEVARIGAAVASALAYAHERGVVHNDVKPENILIDADGEPRLTDFGVARITGATLAPGQADEVVGTIAYVAPEVLQGAPADTAADVYGLATALYEALTGRLPFEAASNAALAAQKLNGRPQPLSERMPAAPPELARLLDGALAFAPGARPSASELALAFKEIADSRPTTVTPAAAVAALPNQPTRRLHVAPVHATQLRRRRGLALTAVALLGALAVAAMAFASAGDGDGGAGADGTATPALSVASTPAPTATSTPVPDEDDEDDEDEATPTVRTKPGRGPGR